MRVGWNFEAEMSEKSELEMTGRPSFLLRRCSILVVFWCSTISLGISMVGFSSCATVFANEYAVSQEEKTVKNKDKFSAALILQGYLDRISIIKKAEHD